MRFSKKRKQDICKQLKIKEIFKEYHEKKLKNRANKRITSKKQVLAIALSIAQKKCIDIKFTRAYLDKFSKTSLSGVINISELERILKSNKKAYNEFKEKELEITKKNIITVLSKKDIVDILL